MKKILEESEKRVRRVSGQEEEITTRTNLIESQCTLVDRLNEMSGGGIISGGQHALAGSILGV